MRITKLFLILFLLGPIYCGGMDFENEFISIPEEEQLAVLALFELSSSDSPSPSSELTLPPTSMNERAGEVPRPFEFRPDSLPPIYDLGIMNPAEVCQEYSQRAIRYQIEYLQGLRNDQIERERALEVDRGRHEEPQRKKGIIGNRKGASRFSKYSTSDGRGLRCPSCGKIHLKEEDFSLKHSKSMKRFRAHVNCGERNGHCFIPARNRASNGGRKILLGDPSRKMHLQGSSSVRNRSSVREKCSKKRKRKEDEGDDPEKRRKV